MAPIKRNENLAVLSREHYSALLASWKVKQGLNIHADIGIIKKYISYFWADHMQPHFEAEEQLLFTDHADSLIARALAEHVELKALVFSANTIEELKQFSTLLHDHVRFEERILFPHLEQQFSDGKLEEVGRQLAIVEANEGCDNFTPEFWKKSN